MITQNIEVKIEVKKTSGFQYNWVEYRLFIREIEWKSITLEIGCYSAENISQMKSILILALELNFS